jgi:hypothetical protein
VIKTLCMHALQCIPRQVHVQQGYIGESCAYNSDRGLATMGAVWFCLGTRTGQYECVSLNRCAAMRLCIVHACKSS